MTPSPVPRHQRISRKIEFMLEKFVTEKDLGEVFYAFANEILESPLRDLSMSNHQDNRNSHYLSMGNIYTHMIHNISSTSCNVPYQSAVISHNPSIHKNLLSYRHEILMFIFRT